MLQQKKFSRETSMIEIKLVAMDKHEFENRDQTLLEALSGKLGSV